MWRIRAAQMDALAEDAERRFTLEIEAHLARWLPRVVETTPRPSLLDRIRAAMREARSFGLASPRDIASYATLSAALDFRLATAPEHAWAGELLRDASIASPSERLRRVTAEVGRRIEREEQDRAARQDFASLARKGGSS